MSGKQSQERLGYLGGQRRPIERHPMAKAGEPKHVGLCVDPRSSPDDGKLGAPVDALPGSTAKIDAMRARLENGQHLWHPNDFVEPYFGGEQRPDVLSRVFVHRKVLRHDQ